MRLDALSELARKERKLLLITSGIRIVAVKTGLVPTKIVALGIQFSETDRNVLLRCVAGLIGYFLISFLIYAADDYVAAKQAGYFRFIDRVKTFEEADRAKDRLYRTIKETKKYRFFDVSHRKLRWVRTTFDFIFPIVVSAYSMLLLWRA